MSKLQDKIYELAKLRENWTLLADMLPAEFLDAVIFEIQKQDARIAELKAELAKRPVMDADKWEADHQRTALEAHGLADEFPYGCDAIEHVAEALVAARAENATIKREREEYLELFEEVFIEFSGMPDDKALMIEWYDDNASSTLRSIADALVKAGRLERHQENKRLYRRKQ